jgi:hypothetical protein
MTAEPEHLIDAAEKALTEGTEHYKEVARTITFNYGRNALRDIIRAVIRTEREVTKRAMEDLAKDLHKRYVPPAMPFGYAETGDV